MNFKEKIIDFSNLICEYFSCSIEQAFPAALEFLKYPSDFKFSNLTLEQNSKVSSTCKYLKELAISSKNLRREVKEAYLTSLKDVENYTISSTPELILLYLSKIAEAISSKYSYSPIKVFTPLCNIGELPYMLKESLKESIELYGQTEGTKDEKIASFLKRSLPYSYELSNEYPHLSYRADLIVSDTLLTQEEDILIFMSDMTDFLSENGTMIVTFPKDFIRSRVFSDNIERYGLSLMGLIEYPEDLLGGILKECIVILKKGEKTFNEFFHSVMPDATDVNSNIENLVSIINYIKDEVKEV